MEIASKYNPSEVEGKWYSYWLDHGFFHSEPDDREAYTIVIPPPNVTGVLHMGHMLNNTIQDILVRRARMLGLNACWVPGTDHASIATEAKVVSKLSQLGIKKSDLTREEFLSHAWEWTREHGGIILEQLKRLGASCDWSRTCFTMDEARSSSVTKVFVDLYEKGLIYRGVRMVNWDPSARTALSDEEVQHREQHGKLYYLRYRIVGESGYALVATTRPETIMGDVAVCINPTDAKNAHLRGKRVIVPLIDREVPIIEDTYVDAEFGTGCLKITPAHDINDYLIGERHNLSVMDIFNDDGTLNAHGGSYAGKDRFAVRKEIEDDLTASGLMERIEPYINKIGFSERTQVPIEPKLSMQWFLRMDTLSRPALEAVTSDKIHFYPSKFKGIYRHWMENVKDWCISRQLWWGHRIPAWYLPDGSFVVAADMEEALTKAITKTGDTTLTASALRQDEDCLDTWFSSWLWPITVFDGINHPSNPDINYYYPTNDLVTAPEIIFFWVARMIMSGYAYRSEPCFRNVYFTGIVRDKQGRKMSKSLGNSPDPIALIDKYGADGVRMGMLLASPAGNDLPFDETLCEQGRNFSNKIWNAFRLVKSWSTNEELPQPEASSIAMQWFREVIDKTVIELNDLFQKYRLSEAMMLLYKLFWDDFSSWYLELIKPSYGQPLDSQTYTTTLNYFDELLRLLHPFMPFITEELWQLLTPRTAGSSVMISPMPSVSTTTTPNLLNNFNHAREITAQIRAIRLKKSISNKTPLLLEVKGSNGYSRLDAVVTKMANLSKIHSVNIFSPDGIVFLTGTTEYALLIPESSKAIDTSAEQASIDTEIAYLEGFLESVIKKLNNERFVTGAKPEIVENERRKRADAESKLSALRSRKAQCK